MKKKVDPYVCDPETGKSATRKFLVRFLASAAGPAEAENGDKIPATLAAVYGPTIVNKQPLYVSKPRRFDKLYIGRAAKVASSTNPDENLWCMIADVKWAAQQLEQLPRYVLALRYFYDFADDSIAVTLNLSLAEVNQVADAALDRMVGLLDCTEHC